MGVELNTVRLLLLAKRMSGVSFAETLTLGRQDLLVTKDMLRQEFAAVGEPLSDDEAEHIVSGASRFADHLFTRLGALHPASMDASSFEGATVVHDLNDDIPPALRQRFSLVLDGGTLEHVFDYPRALRNTMELVAEGGHLVIATPTNNQMGHGFYQLSPELFYRVLGEDNGYEVREMLLAPTFTNEPWYRVRDPAVVGRRVGYNHARYEQTLFVIARRVRIVPLFQRHPQQSDYAAEWRDAAHKADDAARLAFFDQSAEEETRTTPIRRVARALLPESARRLARSLRALRAAEPVPHPDAFERFDHRAVP